MTNTERDTKEKILNDAGKQIVEYLKANCHPYAAVVITADRIAVVEDTLSIPVK